MPEETTARDRAALLRRAGLVGLGVLALIAAVWTWLASGDTDLSTTIRTGLEAARSSAWGPVVAIILLVLLNVAGVPLMILTAGVTAVFGTVIEGFAYSWIASMAGAMAGFWIGRFSGADLVRAHSGAAIARLSERLGNRGILTCFIIRLVPTAPAIVVNTLLGASHIAFWKFCLGTGLGIAPKLAMIALVTIGVLELDSADWRWITAGLVALVAFWLVTMWALRRYVNADAGPEQATGADETPLRAAPSQAFSDEMKPDRRGKLR